MTEGTDLNKRQLLGLLLGGGAWLLGFDEAEAESESESESAKRPHKRRRKPRKHRRHEPAHHPHHTHPRSHPHARAAPTHPAVDHPSHQTSKGLPDPAEAPVTSDPSRVSAPEGLHGGGGGGGAGGGGGGWSDRRLKRDIARLGRSPSGLPVYSFQYVWGGPRYVGVMAQDLLKLRPDAVILDESGYYKVDYARIDVEMREEATAAA
jgi:hypothetical protein